MDNHGNENGAAKSPNGNSSVSHAGQNGGELEQVRTLKELDQALGQVIQEMDEALRETDRAVDAAEEILSA